MQIYPFYNKIEIKMAVSISTFFETKLRAPFHNVVWSWGSENESAVFLRVWQHGTKRVNGETLVCVLSAEDNAVSEDSDSRAGLKERKKHIEAVKEGKPCYGIMCLKNPKVSRGAGSIKSYNSREIFEFGEIREIDGDIYAVAVDRIPASRFKV